MKFCECLIINCYYRQDSLKMEAEQDVLMGEQNWPTESELNENHLFESMPDKDKAAGRDRRTIPDNV
jgi:hypothetical protein